MSRGVQLRQRLRNANMKEFGIFGAFLLLFVVFSVTSPFFFNLENILNIVRQVSLLGIMSVGMTMLITSGEFDLSVGAVYGLSAIVTGLAIQTGVPIWMSILMGLASGAAIGFLNGILNTVVKIPSFIVTLGMLNIARGVALLITGGIPVIVSERTVTDRNLDVFYALGQGEIGGFLPMMAMFLILTGAIGIVIFNKSLLGFRMRAVGGNQLAARASGIKVRGVKIAAFIITGTLAAFAGVLNISFITNVRADSGSGLELQAIAAVVIGGTSLSGGEGTIIGTIIGVLIIGTLRNGLILLGVSPFWQVLIIGVVIIGAVAMDIWMPRKSK